MFCFDFFHSVTDTAWYKSKNSLRKVSLKLPVFFTIQLKLYYTNCYEMAIKYFERNKEHEKISVSFKFEVTNKPYSSSKIPLLIGDSFQCFSHG